MGKDFLIIVVFCNHSKYSEKLFESLYKYHDKRLFDLIVVDANSNNEEVKVLEKFKEVYNYHLIKEKKRLSYSINNNTGYNYATTDLNNKYNYVFLLNPDTYFTDEVLLKVKNVFEWNSKCAVIAPRLKYFSGLYQPNWKRFESPLKVIMNRLGFNKRDWNMVDAIKDKELTGIDYCIGAAMFVRNDIVLSRGYLLDERFKLYCEDIDLCLHTHKVGYSVNGMNDVYLFHDEGAKSYKGFFTSSNIHNMVSLVKLFLKYGRDYFRIIRKLRSKEVNLQR